MRVLIVDDDRTVLEDNREYFEKMGYETVCADTSGTAEEIINSAALDCVILDIDLPDGNGFELCARVRERTGLPIVFLSGYTEEQSRIRGFSIGGGGFVWETYNLKGKGGAGWGGGPLPLYTSRAARAGEERAGGEEEA